MNILPVPVVLDMMSLEFEKPAREHGGSSWQEAKLKRALAEKIDILEAGNKVPEVNHFVSTASLHVVQNQDISRRNISNVVTTFFINVLYSCS